MKNFKKIAAFGIAAAMTMSMGVSAFAEITGTALYENGAVKLQNLAGLDADHQWTVVVIDKVNGNKDLTADMLYYINQGTNGETFWTNGMGTKTELKDGEYIVRIGGETLDTVVEIPLNVTTGTDGKTLTFKWGDVTLDNSIDASDALAALYYGAGDVKSYTFDGTVYTVGKEVTIKVEQ